MFSRDHCISRFSEIFKSYVWAQTWQSHSQRISVRLIVWRNHDYLAITWETISDFYDSVRKARKKVWHFNHSHVLWKLFLSAFYTFALCCTTAVLFLESRERTPLFLSCQVTRLILLLVPLIFYPHFLALNFLLSVPQQGLSSSRAVSEDYSAETKNSPCIT